MSNSKTEAAARGDVQDIRPVDTVVRIGRVGMGDRDEGHHLDAGAQIVGRRVEIEGGDHVTLPLGGAGRGEHDRAARVGMEIDVVAVDRLERAAIEHHLVAIEELAGCIREEQGVDRGVGVRRHRDQARIADRGLHVRGIGELRSRELEVASQREEESLERIRQAGEGAIDRVVVVRDAGRLVEYQRPVDFDLGSHDSSSLGSGGAVDPWGGAGAAFFRN